MCKYIYIYKSLRLNSGSRRNDLSKSFFSLNFFEIYYIENLSKLVALRDTPALLFELTAQLSS